MEKNGLNLRKILSLIDHTLLIAAASKNAVEELCSQAVEAGVCCVCIPPSYVKFSKELLKNRELKVCTVVGFPNGYSTPNVKFFETEDALRNGADEIDMVVNLGNVKNRRYKEELEEISKIKSICGKNILKVIIESCYLTTEEKIEMCKIVTESGADYIKTSTGFGTDGATFDDVKLMKKYIGANVKIKVAGGINDFYVAGKFLDLGASRIGSSKLVKLYLSNSF